VRIVPDQAYRIVDNNEHFLVLDKSVGIAVHSDLEHEAGDDQGLLELVKTQENIKELYPVHRLDKVTSGLLVLAKTRAANRELSMQFERREIEKYYLALSIRKPKKKQGKIVGDMARGRRGSWLLLPSRENPAITQFFSSAAQPGQRLFLLKPKTGKTHQLRVALKSIGAPIAGDALYGGDDKLEQFDRTYLHAYALVFTFGGQRQQFVSLPSQGNLFVKPECLASIEAFGSPWQLAWPN